MQRLEFIEFASRPGANVRRLCRRFGISPSTAYKWMERYRQEGMSGLEDRSRRPLHSPLRSDPALEEAVLEFHARFPYWGARKLRHLLVVAGHEQVPASSTIYAILKRRGCAVQSGVHPHAPYQRFTHEAPNDLWQMDFKGDFALPKGRCYPLTVLDDHSRYALCLQACPATKRSQVQPALERVFRHYGLPKRILCDNGAPWGGTTDPANARYSMLGVWLLRLGVDLVHGRPYHPQTQGKCERFHRTFQVEVLNRSTPWQHLSHCQSAFDAWRHHYNHLRPHQAIEMDTPITRYQPSARSLPAALPPIDYLADDEVRVVKAKGEITFKNHCFLVGQAFKGLPVALRPASPDGCYDIYFAWKRLGQINLNQPLKPKHRYNPLQPF